MLSKMREQTACILLPLLLTPLVSATALTYKLAPNEKTCFFTNVEQAGAKIAFYFAVSVFRTYPRHVLERVKLMMC